VWVCVGVCGCVFLLTIPSYYFVNITSLVLDTICSLRNLSFEIFCRRTKDQLRGASRENGAWPWVMCLI
jgi:hypothetical protein